MAGRKELQIIHHKDVTLYIGKRGTKHIPQKSILSAPFAFYTKTPYQILG